MESKTALDFGKGFSVQQSIKGEPKSYSVLSTGSFHRLTPEQFDALTSHFNITYDVQTLTTDGTYGPTQTFRTCEIDFGGLRLTLFAVVPSKKPVDPGQLSLI